MRIGILETGSPPDEMKSEYTSFAMMFEQLLDGKDLEYQHWDTEGGIFPDSPQAADGWLITGSKHGAYEDHHWIPPLEDFIRDIHAAKIPLIGVCFGHQIIAQALGGKVEKFKDGWVVGRQTYQIDGADRPIHLNAWHQDQVVQVPDNARVIGTSQFCENAVLAYGDTILTLQPHPEFNANFIEGLMQYRAGGLVPKDRLDAAEQDLDQPIDNALIADQIAAVLKRANSA